MKRSLVVPIVTAWLLIARQLPTPGAASVKYGSEVRYARSRNGIDRRAEHPLRVTESAVPGP